MPSVVQRSRLALAGAFAIGALVAVAWNVVPSIPLAANSPADRMAESLPAAPTPSVNVRGSVIIRVNHKIKAALS